VERLRVAGTDTAGASGITSVRFAQRVGGLEVFDGGVKVALDRGGRVLAAVGEPVAGGEDTAPSVPRLDAAGARRALEATVGPTEPVRPASLTRFPAGGQTRLAWNLIERRSSSATYAAVVDATSGEVLLRQNLTKAAALATPYPNYPGAEGGPQEVDLEAAGWLPPGAARLRGRFAQTFSDLDDDDAEDVGEAIRRRVDGTFAFAFVPAETACPPTALAPSPLCTWTPGTLDWTVNREQNGVQAFYLVNRFRDHLERPQIAFGPDGFADADPVVVHARDGAALQDAAHRNNANMTVLPEGLSPRMQMYLFAGQGFRAIDGGDDAATVWHEYAHGLTGRLVTHSDGTSALSSVHSGALGEGWSDFYALDLLHRDGLETDDPAVPGEVDVGAYSDAVPRVTRSQGADCAVGAPAAACPGRGAAGSGGYTFGDLGRILSGPEVHYDGEIWLETLWDVRQRLVAALDSEQAGSDAAERLVTDSLRLLPPEPSFVDARNAMLTADTAAGGAFRALLWEVFAARGLGFFASTRDAGDVRPTESFARPPAEGAPSGTVAGRITDAAGQLGLAGATIGPTLPDGTAASARTGADGRYALRLPAGSYGGLRITGPAGYDAASVPAAVPADGTLVLDHALRRDWAAAAGGARLEPDARGFCGPQQLLDEIDGSGWSAPAPARGGAPPSITIVLPAAIDVTQLGIDPAATCGDGPASALRGYRVESVTANGVLPVLSGSFDSGSADDHRLNLRAPSGNARGVTRLRLTLLSSRGASDFIDISALSVYGARSDGAPRGALAATPATVAPGQAVTFDARSFTDPDSVIASYGWDFDGDGTVDRVTPEPATAFAYDTPGSRTARVVVRDVGGAEGQATAPVSVVAPSPPPVPTTTTPTIVPPPAPGFTVLAPDGAGSPCARAAGTGAASGRRGP
jgi:hypothetical protein